MKQLTIFVMGLFAVAIIAVAGLSAMDGSLPGVQDAREREAQARASLAERQAAIDAQEYAPRQGAISAAVILAVMGLGVGVSIGAAGVGIALARAANLRAETISAQPATGLFPVRYAPGGGVHLVNEPGAQRLAALGARQRVSAPQLGRLLESPGAQAAIEPPAAVDDDLPERVSLDVWRPGQNLVLPVGVAAGGRVLQIPIGRADYSLMLVSGLPGSGKSGLLHTFVSAIARQSPDGRRVQLAICDPKQVEFAGLDGGFMWRDVVSSRADIADTIHDVRGELENRLSRLASARRRTWCDDPEMSLLVLVIDELGVISGDSSVMADLTDVARLGRAGGILTIAATQRVSAHTLRPELRALADWVVSFRVRSLAESKLSLADCGGAELIPPIPGRCIVKRSELTPAQAFFDAQPVAPGHYSVPTPYPAPVEPVAPVAEPVTMSPELPRLSPGDSIPVDVANLVRQYHRDGWSMNRLTVALFGFKSGATLDHVRAALRNEP